MHIKSHATIHFIFAFLLLSASFPINSILAETLDEQARLFEKTALTTSGNIANGKRLFASEKAKCSLCHRLDGKGGEIGPDLSVIGGKYDRSHLIESLLEPSRQIVEGYRATVIVTDAGKVFTGVIRKQTPTVITVGTQEGKLIEIPRDEIEEQQQSDVSLMPAGLNKELTTAEFTDLIAFLESLQGNVKASPGSKIVGAIKLPDQFEIETIATGLTGATALELTPDGRIFVSDQTGSIRVVQNNQLLPEPLLQLPVDSSWERGILGIAVDPEFEDTPYLYVCYVSGDLFPHHRISRFKVTGNHADPKSEQILLSGDDQRNLGGKIKNGHQGGAIHFGPDGCLYIAIGDQTAGEPAQKLDSLLGKILRIHADGRIPDDNPFLSETSGKYRSIWAIGFRNPFTFAIDSVSGLLLANDVGGYHEEVNAVQAGGNYGWPVADHGPDPPAPFIGAIHWYREASIAGGDFVPADSKWPEKYRGKYLFADFKLGWIHSIDPLDGAQHDEFMAGLRRPVDLRFDSQDDLYILLRNAWVIDQKFQPGTGSLIRVRYQP